MRLTRCCAGALLAQDCMGTRELPGRGWVPPPGAKLAAVALPQVQLEITKHDYGAAALTERTKLTCALEGSLAFDFKGGEAVVRQIMTVKTRGFSRPKRPGILALAPGQGLGLTIMVDGAACLAFVMGPDTLAAATPPNEDPGRVAVGDHIPWPVHV